MDQNEQMEFFYQLFDPSLPRLGAGDDSATRKALNELLAARSRRIDMPGQGKIRILDIGCGNGAQTIQLVGLIDGTIVAVDNHQPFLDELARRAEARGVSGKIRLCLKDMRELGEADGTFDLIWSEGALFVMGFSKGLEMCHSLLIPGGGMAVSELCWIRPDPPEECRQFFAAVYPPMADIETNLSTIRNCGYEVQGHFVLPESAWWEQFYIPLEERLRVFRERY